jgi:hypothetical protein
MFTPSGPGGIFGLYTNHGAHLRYVFLNEFMLVRALFLLFCWISWNIQADLAFTELCRGAGRLGLP